MESLPSSSGATKPFVVAQGPFHPLSGANTRAALREVIQTSKFQGGISGQHNSTISAPYQRSVVSSLQCGHTPEEAKMQRRLKYHFMNPWQKYKTKGRIPYKLMVQLLKILLVTIQLIVFGRNSANHVTFNDSNRMAFHHLFLEKWDASQETPPYPASHGPFAVYTYTDFYAKMDYAAAQYYNASRLAIGSYGYSKSDEPQLHICRKYYRVGKIYAANQSYEFDSDILNECVQFYPIRVTNATDNSTNWLFDTKDFLERNNVSMDFDGLLAVSMKMSLRTVQLMSFDLDYQPNCFQFNIVILFDNTNHDGLVPVILKAPMEEIACHGIVHKKSNISPWKVMYTALDILVIVLSVVSIATCIRSLYRGRLMYLTAKNFFIVHFKGNLDQDKWEFLNCWFIVIVINDILVVVGSIFKLLLDNKKRTDYEVCGYLLGIGSMLVWLGVLRYVAFSYKNNILLLTLRRALPNVMRFMLCALAIFIAFSLCGWVVLGPYHVKFRTFSSSLECLFSLMNGDDLYTTFSIIPYSDGNNALIFYFSRVYQYGFCCLFIYVVLNLFITIIIEAYEDVKKLRATHGHPNTLLWTFILACPDVPGSSTYIDDDDEGHDNDACDNDERKLQSSFWKKSAANVWHSVLCTYDGVKRWIGSHGRRNADVQFIDRPFEAHEQIENETTPLLPPI